MRGAAVNEIARAWEENRTVEERDRARGEIVAATGGALACPVCRRGAQLHSLAEARACLSKIASGESMAYCRLTGPKR